MKLCKRKFFAVSFVIFLSGGICIAGPSDDKQESRNVIPVAPVQAVKPVVPSVELGKMKMPDFPSMPKKNTAEKNNSAQYVPGQKYVKPEQKTESKTTQISNSAPEELTKENILKQLNSISATDLTALSGQGLLPNLTSLVSKTSNAGLANSTLLNQTQNQNEVLEQILKELNEIKAAQSEIKKPDFSKLKPSTEPPAILRFVVNSYDLLKSCNAVYFSDETNDGSFLLTGDCKALYNKAVLSETFYIYFKAAGTRDGRNIYHVELSVSQDKDNKNSLLYKFCERQNIIAYKTGNLITIRETTDGYTSDLLLDIGK